MTDFQKKTIETAAEKLKGAVQAFKGSHSSLRTNLETQEYHRQNLLRLEKESVELKDAIESAREKAIEAQDHFDYVCKEYADAGVVLSKPESVFNIFGFPVRYGR